MIPFILLALLTVQRPLIQSELIFPPSPLHSHASCIVQLPNGDVAACWYQGHGERSADDVRILGARLKKGSTTWSEPIVWADTPGFPDCNPATIVDSRGRLLLFWPLILENKWETALLCYKIAGRFEGDKPIWIREGPLPLKPGPEFAECVDREMEVRWKPYLDAASPALKERGHQLLAAKLKAAHEKLPPRLGWMPRAHPTILPSGRILLPLYSDGFDFSLIAISDDGAETWTCSKPIVGPGNVQPSIARRKDGTLVAYFRDNGPPPQRVMVSESTDDGISWTAPRDIEVPNPGSGLEVTVLKSGRWLLIHNDTERGRNSLAVSISDDEGRTWPRKKHLERDDSGGYSYPSIIQARDGSIHATYSWHGPGQGESIKHVHFNEAWLLAAD